MSEKTKILIIDDERDIVLGMSVRLRAAGYEVLTAYDGAAGLALAFAALPDGILLDLCMPGMDSIAVLEGLKNREETQAIPVVVVSASVVEHVRNQAFASGACGFVGKPFQAEKLLAAIEHAVGARSAGCARAAD